MSTKKNYSENAKKSHGGLGLGLGYVQRTEVIVKMQKKKWGRGGSGWM